MGSIPACTGEPAAGGLFGVELQVYLRVYGGTLYTVPATPQLRSIPACTGEPNGRTWGPNAKQVYPRVYGGTSTDFITLFVPM